MPKELNMFPFMPLNNMLNTGFGNSVFTGKEGLNDNKRVVSFANFQRVEYHMLGLYSIPQKLSSV
jgi:hypothetical protein